MTASGDPSLSRAALHSTLMSNRSSFELWDYGSSGVGEDFARQELLSGTFGRGRCSCLFLMITILSVFLSAHALILDELSQDRIALNKEIYYEAFKALNMARIKTGTVYNASLPSNITDKSVELVQMVRLRSGSLRRYGFQFNEIMLPKGVKVVQALRSVVLVYRRFRQYRYYDATLGNVLVAPVVGILVYNAGEITNYTDIRPELTIIATGLPIQVQLHFLRNVTPNNVTCIMYNNTVNGTDVGAVKNFSAPAVCSWGSLGDYSLLAPSVKARNYTWKIVLGSVAGSTVFCVLLSLIVLLAVRYRERARFANMEHKSEEGETLHHTLIGGSRAPAAASTRTKPILENDHLS